MGINNSMIREQYPFLKRPSNLPEPKYQRQLVFFNKCYTPYKLIQGLNGKLFRYYKRTIQNQEIESQVYHWRNITNKPIVKVMHIQILQTSSPSKLSIGVYTQHFTKTLNEIKKLSIAQTIYLLKKILSGYQEIFNTFCFAAVQPSNAGINEKGQCIVWISDDLSLNSAKNPTIRSQSKLISQIIKIIELTSNKQCKIFFQNLYKYINSLKICNFKLVDDFIRVYCQKFQITIPLYLKYESQQLKSQKDSKYMKFSNNKSQEFMCFRKKSITNISQNKSLHNQIISPIRKPITKNISNQRISIVDRIPFLEKIQNYNQNTEPQKIQTKSMKGFFNQNNKHSDKNTTTTRIESKASDFQQPQIKNQDIKRLISPQLKRYSLNCPKNVQLSSLNALLLQINQKDEQISIESPSEKDHILEQRSSKTILPTQMSHFEQKIKNKHICHQFSINIINETVPIYYRPNLKESAETDRSRFRSQIQNNQTSYEIDASINKSINFDTNRFRGRLQRFKSQTSEEVYDNNKSKVKNIKQNFKQKEVESATAFQNSKSQENKQNQFSMSMRNSKQMIKKNRNRIFLDSPQKRQQQNYKIAIKNLQENVINTNNWKKIVNKLLSSEKDMQLKHSMSYQFDEEKTPSPLLEIKLEKLDRVGRHTNSIIPK